MKKGARTGKGSDFERTISKQLSLWASDGSDDSWYWRTSQSGGRATIRDQKGKRTSGGAGDITSLDPKGASLTDFCVLEVKRGYSTMNVLDLIDSKKKHIELVDFWKQIHADMKKSNKPYGILIFKRDYKNTCVMLPMPLYEQLTISRNLYSLRVFIAEKEYIILDFTDFLAIVKIDMFINLIKENLNGDSLTEIGNS